MDSANREEALKALSMARKYLSANPPNVATAKRLALKSVALCETSEAMNFLEKVRAMEEELKDAKPTPNDRPARATNGSATANGDSHTTGAEPFAGAEGVRHRHTNTSTTGNGPSTPNQSSAATNSNSEPNEKREYTAEQFAVVKRIRKCKVTQYYEIMGLQKDCEEADIKKAYRKLALQLHPDKNGAPGADEAFKMVSKAFQVLSDASLRAAFDRDGGDPESRFGSGMRPTNMRSPFTANGGFEGELSPEDLFNMFFGGGFGGPGFGTGGVQFGQFGGGFGGAPMFTASFGPGGFRTTRVRTRQTNGNAANGAQAAEAADRPRGFRGVILQLLPILIFLFMAFSNTIFDIFTALFSTPDPSYSFIPTPYLSQGRSTGGRMDIPYFVNPSQFAAHPYSTPLSATEQANSKAADNGGQAKERRSAGLKRWERTIEERWVNWKYNECTLSRERIDRQIENHRGVFGLGTDWEAVKKLRDQRKNIETCNELREKGYSI